MKRQYTYIVKIVAVTLSILFIAAFFTGSSSWADTSPGNKIQSDSPTKSTSPVSEKDATLKASSSSSSDTKQNPLKAGGAVSKGFYSSGSSSKPYSPFATNLSSSSSKTPSLAQDSVPSSFGSGWTGEVITFAANNLLNSSNPASAQDPSVTPSAVISFLKTKNITVATGAETEITNEVNNLLSTYNDHPSLSDGAPLARIFAIQIMCMKNTSTGQLVYPEAFPQDMLDKDYSSEYQSSWNAATSGKSYTLNATYIYDFITYTTSNSIWEDPSIDESGVYSLDQIEQDQLKSMKVEAGEINSLNLIGITQRAYAIKTNPPSMSIDKGYLESTGDNENWDTPAGGVSGGDVVSPGSYAKVDFTVETGTTPSSALSATLTLSGAPNAQIDKSSFSESGLYWVTDSDFDITLSNNNRTAVIKYIDPSLLNANTTFTFSFNIDVTSPSSYTAQVCSIAQGEVTFDNSTLTLQGSSDTWCFPVVALSENSPSPSQITSSSPTSTVSMTVPGWVFQYNSSVTNTLWSSLNGNVNTSLSAYQDFQPSSPNLDQYSVSSDKVSVKDLTTGKDVTSLFTSAFTPASSYNTYMPYSGASSYGGWQLSPATLQVSWNDSWPSSASSPLAFDVFQVTFPLALTHSVGGDIYTQASTSSSSSSTQSDVFSISTPLSAPALAPINLSAAGIAGSDGEVESSSATATLGVPMTFEADAAFPSASQISAMQSASQSFVFYSYDAASDAQSLKGATVNGIALSSLPQPVSQSQDGAVAILLTPADLTYISNHASTPSKLIIRYNWYVTSSPNYATSETGYVKGSSLSLSATNYQPQFVSSSSALTLTVSSNGTGPLTPNADQSSAVTGIWFDNQLLGGENAKGSEFTVQNASGLYLTPSSSGQPPYSFSSSPYEFSSTDGEGLFRMWGLADGTYTITQVALPQNAFGTKPSFKVSLNYASGKPESISDPDPASLVDANSFMVFNQGTPAHLPLTGGQLKAILFCAILPVVLALAGYASYKIYKLRS
ncbi:MAG: hypothetical protein J6S17_03490 [Aeriscardovia sp.]|nr:hypothetical protein [Aeriscardovia sp.]